jgi:hypothetical protein
MPSTFVPATNVKKPNALRGSVKSSTSALRYAANRHTVSVSRTTNAATHTIDNAVEMGSSPSSSVPTEMIPVAITRAK